MGDRPRGLIDTGALLAILNRRDDWHLPCMEALSTLRWPLATSAAVLAELFHFLLKQSRDLDAAWSLIRSEAVVVRPLVHLARREQLDTVFTIDHDDFETYRIDGRRRFQIVPGR